MSFSIFRNFLRQIVLTGTEDGKCVLEETPAPPQQRAFSIWVSDSLHADTLDALAKACGEYLQPGMRVRFAIHTAVDAKAGRTPTLHHLLVPGVTSTR